MKNFYGIANQNVYKFSIQVGILNENKSLKRTFLKHFKNIHYFPSQSASSELYYFLHKVI